MRWRARFDSDPALDVLGFDIAMTSTALTAHGVFPNHFATYYHFFQRRGLAS